MLTSATVSDDGPGHGAVQVPEIDGTLFESEVNDEEILDEDDDVGDLHATIEADDEEVADSVTVSVVPGFRIQRFSFQVLILGSFFCNVNAWF